MKSFLLSLMLIFSISFAVNAARCTDCWSYADGYEAAGGDWFDGLDYCNENLSPCVEQLEPVVIKK